MECGSFQGIKLMSHTMKTWERIVDNRIRSEVVISQERFGFMKGRSTEDAIFALRQLLEKYKEGQRKIHCTFIDLEKAYDRVPREELVWCMRKKKDDYVGRRAMEIRMPGQRKRGRSKRRCWTASRKTWKQLV